MQCFSVGISGTSVTVLEHPNYFFLNTNLFFLSIFPKNSWLTPEVMSESNMTHQRFLFTATGSKTDIMIHSRPMKSIPRVLLWLLEKCLVFCRHLQSRSCKFEVEQDQISIIFGKTVEKWNKRQKDSLEAKTRPVTNDVREAWAV